MADNEKFFTGKDAKGAPLYTYQNNAMSKEDFDKQTAQSANEMDAFKNQKDDFDSQFDDMKAKTLTLKRPLKKAKGGAIKSSASSRADGCATKGKTKARFV